MPHSTLKLWEERILEALDRVPLEVYIATLAVLAGGSVAGLVWLLC